MGNKGFILQPGHVRQLLQRKIISSPIELPTGKSILYLSDKGILMDIPVPDSQAQKQVQPVVKLAAKVTKKTSSSSKSKAAG